MIQGKFPSRTLLELYDLKEYLGIVDAVLNGDMQAFEKEIEQYMDQFI